MTSSMIRNGSTAAMMDEKSEQWSDERSEHWVIVRVGKLAKVKPSQTLTAVGRRCFGGMTLG